MCGSRSSYSSIPCTITLVLEHRQGWRPANICCNIAHWSIHFELVTTTQRFQDGSQGGGTSLVPRRSAHAHQTRQRACKHRLAPTTNQLTMHYAKLIECKLWDYSTWPDLPSGVRVYNKLLKFTTNETGVTMSYTYGYPFTKLSTQEIWKSEEDAIIFKPINGTQLPKIIFPGATPRLQDEASEINKVRSCQRICW